MQARKGTWPFPSASAGKKKRISWSRQGMWLTTLRWKKIHIFYCFAWNLACNFKVSCKYRTLHCTGLELPKLLMDSGGLDTARKGLPRHQKAENYFLGERMHHQQHPRTGPRSSFSCFLLLKGFFAAVLQRMGLYKCRTTAASCLEHRIWNCPDTLQRSVKYQLSKPPAFAGCLNNCWGRLAGILPMGKSSTARDPPFPLQDRWVKSSSSSQVPNVTSHYPSAKGTVTSPESWHSCSLELPGSRVTALTIWF